MTVGRSKLSIGFNLLHANYNSLNGVNLRNGDLKIDEFSSNQSGTEFHFEELNLASTTAVVFGRVGVPDRVEIGWAVPVVSVSMSG